MAKKFYITAAIPYVNSAPHVGHALEFVQVDTLARYHKLLDEDVLSLSGGDENALKNVQAAEAVGEKVQSFVDRNTQKFFDLTRSLNCQFDVWQKGSDTQRHFPSSQKLWKLCEKAGDIYKKRYEGLYCLGCEAFYTESELNENGECREHPGKPLQLVSEENYFFKLSRFQKQLIDLISTDTIKIIPEERKNEVLSFLEKEPLEDISISRSNERAKNWGVPVPGDNTQRLYVWFDALNIYQSGVGFGWNEKDYIKWWPADVHVIGKGIIRFHAVYWPAFLLSARLSLPRSIFVHGYFTVNGQKMSKTLGNVIDPKILIQKYGTDALRYYLLAKFSPFSDGDFSEKKLKDAYNGDLANGLGNLVSRIATLCQKANVGRITPKKEPDRKVGDFIQKFELDKAIGVIWAKIKLLDAKISELKPWEIKESGKLSKIISPLAQELVNIAYLLTPFLPDTSNKIVALFSQNNLEKITPLFPRIK